MTITALIQDYERWAIAVAVVSYLIYELGHFLRAAKWTWKRWANGCIEACIFLLISFVFLVVFNSMSHKHLSLDALNEPRSKDFLPALLTSILILFWNARRWKRLGDYSSTPHRSGTIER